MRFQQYLAPLAMSVGVFNCTLQSETYTCMPVAATYLAVWLLCCRFLTGILSDFVHFFRKRIGNVRMGISLRDWPAFLGFKLQWLLLHIVLPVYQQGWMTGLLQCFVAMAIAGHYMYQVFIVSHIQPGLVPPRASDHWAAKQVLSTANWGSGSIWANWISAGPQPPD